MMNPEFIGWYDENSDNHGRQSHARDVYLRYNGWYTDENIDSLLMERHLAKKARRSSKHHLKGPAKRMEDDDRRFEESFERMIQEAL